MAFQKLVSENQIPANFIFVMIPTSEEKKLNGIDYIESTLAMELVLYSEQEIELLMKESKD
eukprot:snap_masked-scaffold_24-processed-gene-0.37-mRNA-1 protein AED:1.00 eAED:1.00 QI:0/0/0/0/1/1/2/0/60